MNVRQASSSRGAWIAAILACAAFIAVALILLPYNGIEDDESLFAGPLYARVPQPYRIRMFHHDIPLMIMDYIGALKSWLYAPILHFWKPSLVSIRIPAIAIGAVTVWLFFLFLKKAAGNRAAVLGTLLLATDPMFLMTTEFDWGPVAIQHLMLVTGCLTILGFYKTGSSKLLGAGFFAFGLGLWDKALFSWILTGLAVAAVAVFPREVLQRVTTRNFKIAAAGFLLGAWPLIVFNGLHGGRTFRNNASFSTENLAGKVAVLRTTLRGDGLFAYMVNEPDTIPVKSASTALERASTHLVDVVGERRMHYMSEAVLASVLLALFRWRRMRAVWFALVAMTVAWIEMALTRNAGGGVHHVILLWPFPQFIVAIALAGTSEHWKKFGGRFLAIVAAFLCGANLLVANQYLSQFVRYGPSVTWTNAIFPLSDSLVEGAVRDVYVVDWDIFDTLLMLHEGRIRMNIRTDVIMKDNPTPADNQSIDAMLMDSQAVFVGHTPDKEFFVGTSNRLDQIATARGYRKELLRTIYDYHGRPVFLVYRFRGQGQ